MNNNFKIVEDVSAFLKTTKATEFYIVMDAPSATKVYSIAGWASVEASKADWPPETEIFNRGNLNERYYDIVRDARQHAAFADATEIRIQEKTGDNK